ncbi:MAG: zinc-binding dehydrogenase [Chloroflexi bacterium]|nr:zinc-binding dehydrogenase [Chloroflexota bacterium]
MDGLVAVFHESTRPFDLRRYPVPEPGPGEILVRVRMANVCGSDLHFRAGHGPGLPKGIPHVLGHEMMGEVFALGPGATRDSQGHALKAGDRVVYAYFRDCGVCPTCLHRDGACPNRYRNWIGVSVEEYPHFHGAFGQFYVVRPGQWVFRVPEELPDHMVSAVNCALAEVIYGLHKGGLRMGDTVVVQGAGGLGLYATAVAREMGAGKIVVSDLLQHRLETAEAFGADHVLNASYTDPQERESRVKEWTGGHGADLVIELTGDPKVVQEGINMLRPGGRYVLIGNINLGLTTTLDPATLVRYSRNLIGIIVYEGWAIPRALEFLLKMRKRYPLDKVVSHTFPLESINQAFEVASQRQCLRVGLIP